ncbi:MAG: hypothetical protein M2R45_03751 [Verrucomicrobia subdivision 3 bacterium]|nr:hypothetical protein [Limisphaerales bacterium]MCS1416925.1 hypothetical protein [Limisphaerales bacterium]
MKNPNIFLLEHLHFWSNCSPYASAMKVAFGGMIMPLVITPYMYIKFIEEYFTNEVIWVIMAFFSFGLFAVMYPKIGNLSS